MVQSLYFSKYKIALPLNYAILMTDRCNGWALVEKKEQMIREKNHHEHVLRPLILILILICMLCCMTSQTPAEGFSDLEFDCDQVTTADPKIWVEQQIAERKEADLALFSKCAGDEGRDLPASFLEDLLTGPFERVGVEGQPYVIIRILHARIKGPLNLRELTVRYRVALINCEFQDDAIFSHSMFLQPASFRGSSFTTAHFLNTEFKEHIDFQEVKFIDANFLGIHVGGTALFRGAVFVGDVRFDNAMIAHQFNVQEARFRANAFFNRIRVGDTAFLQKATFEGAVHFDDAVVHRLFRARETRFDNDGERVSFVRMHVGGSIDLTDAKFMSGVRAVFQDVVIGGDFQAQSIEIYNSTESVSFQGMRVEGTTTFEQAEFWGPTTFRRARFDRLEANHAQFMHPTAHQNFSEMQVNGTASFAGAIFHGPVSFLRAAMGRLEATQTQFMDPIEIQDFGEIRVGSTAVFNQAVFSGEVSFQSAVIASDFWASKTTFSSPTARVSFEGMKVGNKMILETTIFG